MRHLLRMISARHLFGSPLRSLITVVGVAVGVATMVGVVSINRSVMEAFRSTVDTISGKADLTVAASAIGFDEALLDRVREVPGVLHASGGITVIASVHGVEGERLYVMGVDLLDDGFFRDYEAIDRDIGSLAEDLEFLNSTDRMLVSERFARTHGLKVGDTFQLTTGEGVQDFIVHALVKETGPIKAFGGSVGIMYLGSAQEAFHRGRTIDRIDIAKDPEVSYEELKARVQEAVGPAFEVDRPSRRGGSVEKMVRGFQMGLNLGSGLALMVGVFLVYNTMAIGVLQRRREIGTLRALGATRMRVRALFTLEALLMGSLGTCLGIPLGLAVARVAIFYVASTVSALYVQVNPGDVKLAATEVVLGVALGVAGSVFAALRPATHASRVQPVEALRRDIAAGADVAALKKGPILAGLALLAAVYPLSQLPQPSENAPVGGFAAIFAALFGMSFISPLILRGLQGVYEKPGEWAFGIAGQLAAGNFSRAPARTAVPVSALMVGVAMTLSVGGFVHSFEVAMNKWIDEAVPADLFVTSSAKLAGVQNTPMSPALADELTQLPGVEGVDKVRIFRTPVLDLETYVISLIPEIHEARAKPIVIEGEIPTPKERLAGKISVSENFARRRNLHPGDPVPIHTRTGVHTFWVNAVVVDYSTDQGALFMDRRVFVEKFADDRVDSFELYLKPGASLEGVRREVTERWGKQYDLYVLSNDELRAEANRLLNGAFSVTYAMEAVAMLLALLGVVNTLLAAVIDRTREIGLLRAIGASRRHVTGLFTAEAGFIGLTGGLMGLLAGMVLGKVVTHVVGVQATGLLLPYAFPYRLAALMLLSATLCALVAGLYPARRASDLDVVEALAYE